MRVVKWTWVGPEERESVREFVSRHVSDTDSADTIERLESSVKNLSVAVGLLAQKLADANLLTKEDLDLMAAYPHVAPTVASMEEDPDYVEDSTL